MTAKTWPTVVLRSVLTLDLHRVPVDARETYGMAGVYSFGRGLFGKGALSGASTSYKVFYRLAAEHVVMSQLFGWEGALALSSPQYEGLYVSPQFPTFTCSGNLDRHFLGWLIRRPAFWEELASRTKGMGDRRRTLNPDALLSIPIPLPPLDEQRRIVARIQALAAKIEEALALRQQAAEETEGLVASTATHLLAGIRFGGRLEDVLLGRPRNGWSVRCDNSENGTPVLSLGAITGFRYRPAQYKKTSHPAQVSAHYWLRQGDLLISRSNTPDLVGHAAIYNGSPSPCIYPDLMMRLAVDEQGTSKAFVHWLLRSSPTREYIRRVAKGTSPTMKKISQQDVMNIPFPTGISIREQTSIVAYLDGLQAKVDALKRMQAETAAQLDALLPSILDRAFKGQL